MEIINHELRAQLSQDLRRLVVGRMSIAAYDDAIADKYMRANDTAVKEVCEFGCDLYGDFTPQFLKGRHAVDAWSRRVASRCVLFLKSDLPYEWPAVPRMFVESTIDSLAFMGVPGGIASVICSLPLLIKPEPNFYLPWLMAFGGAALTAASVWYLRGPGGYNASKLRAWRATGDFDVWPFFRREDFYRARRGRVFLSGKA